MGTDNAIVPQLILLRILHRGRVPNDTGSRSMGVHQRYRITYYCGLICIFDLGIAICRIRQRPACGGLLLPVAC